MGDQPSDFEPEDEGYELGPAKQYTRGIVTGIGFGTVPWAGAAIEIGLRTGIVDPGSRYEQVGRALGEMGIGVAELLGGVTEPGRYAPIGYKSGRLDDGIRSPAPCGASVCPSRRDDGQHQRGKDDCRLQ